MFYLMSNFNHVLRSMLIVREEELHDVVLWTAIMEARKEVCLGS